MRDSPNRPPSAVIPSIARNKAVNLPKGDVEEAGAMVFKSVPAVKRAAAILWLLAENATPMSLSQVARKVDILPSTALHILRELVSSRLVAFDAAQKAYRLGQGLVDIAQTVNRHDDFPDRARPHLQAIASKFDVTAMAISKIDERHVACVAYAMPPVSVSLNVTLGGRVPTMSGAAGRCIAAFSNKSIAQLRKSFALVRWQVPFSFDDWMKQVESARINGFGEDEGIFALGVTTLAAPIFSPDGTVTRAIGIASISAGLNNDRKAAIAAALVHAAEEISRRLRE